MRARRALSAALLAVLVAGGLTACQTKVGLAAAVNDVRLSDSDLSSYVKPGAAPYTDPSDGSKIVPKLYVLQVWIRTRLFERAVAANGSPISAGERRAASAFLLGSSQTIGDVEKSFGKQGYEPKLADLVVDSSATLLVLVQRLVKGSSLTQAEQLLNSSSSSSPIIASITKTKPVVRVSSRYGAWDEGKLSLSQDSTAGLPSFVTVPSAAATAG